MNFFKKIEEFTDDGTHLGKTLIIVALVMFWFVGSLVLTISVPYAWILWPIVGLFGTYKVLTNVTK